MSNNTASATTAVSSAGQPDVTVVKSHSGNFSQGQTAAQYTIVVSNIGSASTTGPVSVTDSLPGGLVASALVGSGWTCNLGTLTCTRSDALPAGSSYPAITLTVSVDSNAPASVINIANVTGGGDTTPTNNSSPNSTTINGTPSGQPATPVPVDALWALILLSLLMIISAPVFRRRR
jgi:uncharacterized repeat protein (TIGR01451 family)